MKVNVKSLELLTRLKNSPIPLSGEALAKEMGISRVAFWKRIEGLRSLGYVVGSDRRGYHLVSGDEALPWEFPQDESPVYFFPETESTMDLAAQKAREGALEGTIVTAGKQTRGRGTQGRLWLSPVGGLYATLILRWDLPLAQAGAVALTALSVLARVLKEQTGRDFRIVWPNDLFYREVKVGGVLLEVEGGFHKPNFWLVGLGLNVHRPVDPSPFEVVETQQGVASRPQILEKFRRGLLEGCGRDPRLWEEFSWPLGTLLKVTPHSAQESPLLGKFEGYSPHGDLLVAGKQLRFGDCRRVEGVSLEHTEL